MPTIKKKATRTMTCKLCGKVGYNSRNCPTKTAPWTVLCQEELDNITKTLGISVSEVSQAQIDFALSKRPVDFNGEILSHFYHDNKDRFDLALKLVDNKPEPQDDNAESTLSSQEQVALTVMSDDSDDDVSQEQEPEPTNYEVIEDIRWQFDRELFFISREPSEEEQLEIGNSIFVPTFRDDGSIHLQVMISNIGYGSNKSTHTCMYEFEDIGNIAPGEIAADFLADYLGVISDVEPDVTPASVYASPDLSDDEEELSEEELSEETEDQALFDDDDDVSEDQALFDDDEELSFDDDDCMIDHIPEGALFIGYEGNDTGFDMIFFDEDLGYLQGTKTVGFSFSTELGFVDTENVIKAMRGTVELIPVDVSDLKMLKFMRPDAIPFQMWEDIELDLTSEEFTSQWLVPVNSDVDPIILGAKIDPVGKRWLVQAVCIEQ